MATGVIYDDAMADYHCLWDSTYVENPDRFNRVMERCRALGLIQRCVDLKPRKALESELLMAHSQHLIDLLKSTSGEEDQDKLMEIAKKYDCVYLHPNIYELARLAAGCAIELTDQVLSGRLKNGFGILRPPGHHAMFNEICGYCFFNNVVLSAKHALNQGLKKILIVDWDVHHGQGTQRAFYNDPRVVYFSLHRFELGTWWPELPESDFDHIGEGPGIGFNVNVPLNRIGNTDTDYMAVFLQVLLPLAMEFEPELVLISAGFDPALGCPEGEQNVSPVTFSHLMHLCNSFAGGKTVALMEGGYFMSSHAEGAAMTLKTLLGDPCPKLPEKLATPCPEILEAVKNVKTSLRPFWKCFQREAFDPKYAAKTVWKGPTGPPATEFDPMCPTPIRPQEVEDAFEAQISALIASTDLSKTTGQLALVAHAEEFEEHLWSLQDVIVPIPIAQADNPFKDQNIQALLKVLTGIAERSAQSGLVVLPPFANLEQDLASVLNHCKHTLALQRTLCISIGDCTKFKMGSNSDLISFSLDFKDSPAHTHFEKNDIQVDLCVKNVTNADLEVFHALYRIILPMCYEFQPDLILVHSSLSSSYLSPRGHGMMAYLLQNLAHGNVCYLLEGAPGPFSDIRILSQVAHALVKWTPPKIILGDLQQAQNFEALEKLRSSLASQWDFLQ
eukprot:maker-scaffold334_size202906-snap-gene-1.24 protein:Tk08963 transcript:maker-scaffold334_size202906-snap-gene-1.24-mRNA-1 annotation:"hypothetical protein DAPPUDRAFT_98501"